MRRVVTPPRIFLRVVLRSLERDARVGELVPIVVRVDSDAETRLTLRFDSAAFELVAGSPDVSVGAGSHDVEWGVYVRNAAVGERTIDVLARRDQLVQMATMVVRVHVDDE
jgi:hypothetical protein